MAIEDRSTRLGPLSKERDPALSVEVVTFSPFPDGF